jgi:hypothetical protein
MARRGAAIEIEFSEEAITLRSKGRALTITNAAQDDDRLQGLDFVVLLDDLQFWAPPDEATPIEIEELTRILEAIEDLAERRGVLVAFE